MCSSPGYFARAGVPQTPADLARHNCLIYAREGRPDHWKFVQDGRELTVQPRGNLRVNNGDALKIAAMHGLGIAQLPLFLAKAELASGALQPVLTACERPPLAIHAVYPHNRHVSAKVRVFVDELVKRLGPEGEAAGA